MGELKMLGNESQTDLAQHPILLVDDDQLVCSTLSYAFTDLGFSVETANNGKVALEMLGGELKDKIGLIILDWKMPGLSGLDVFRMAREMGVHAPTIFLTGLRDPMHEESALKLGAVDFVDKSKSFNILLKRVELVFNGRNYDGPNEKRAEDNVITIGDLQLNNHSHRATWKNQEVRLALSEFEIVKLLVGHVGDDITHKDIHILLHGENFAVGYGPEGYRANVRTAIKRIRKKFCDVDPGFSAIETYTGFGYRWQS